MISRAFWFVLGLVLIVGAVLLYESAGPEHWGVWTAGLLGLAAIIFSFVATDHIIIDAGPNP